MCRHIFFRLQLLLLLLGVAAPALAQISPDIPPTIGLATAGNGRATVTFAAPASNTGDPITGYTVSSNSGAGVDSNAGTLGLSHVVTGLTNGTTYSFTVVANTATPGFDSPASGASNAVVPATVPGAPIISTVTPGNGQVTVVFAAPATGGSAITGYTVTSTPAGAGGDVNGGSTGLSHIVDGLTNGVSYTFKVTATNAMGAGAASAASSAAVPVTVPGAPTIGTATVSGDGQATVSFSAPASNGGTSITGYTVRSSPTNGAIADSNAGSLTSPHVVTGLTNGTVYTFTVTATNAAGTGPASGASNTVTLQIPQAIGFASPPILTFGGTAFVSATGGGSGNAVTFASNTPSICTVSGSMVTAVALGTCTVAANQAGNANYVAAPQVTQNIIIGKASQTITFGLQGRQLFGAAPFALSPLASSSSGLPVTYTATSKSVCTLAGTTVTIVTTGACTIAVSQAGDSNYNPASVVTQDIIIAPASQTIGFGPQPDRAFSTAAFALNPQASASSGLPVSYSSLTPSICSVKGSNVTAVTLGTCTIAADQVGSATYNPAPQVTQNILITEATQSITFPAQAGKLFSATPFVLNPLATASSGLAVSYSSASPSVCSVKGSSVTTLSLGVCTIAADQAGNASYGAAAQVTQDIIISQASQSITFGAQGGQVYGAAPFALKPLATASSGLAVSYKSLSASVCSISGNTVTIVGAGSCTIAANQAGNANYAAAAQATQNITIAKADQTVSFGAQGRQTVGSFAFNPLATTSSGLDPNYASATPKVCTVSGNTVTALMVGTCTINAGQLGNGNYNPAVPIVRDIAIGMGATPTCTLVASPTLILAGSSAVLTASCNPAPSSYLWSTNSGFGASVAAGTVSPTVTTVYTVAGVNANGAGNTASASVAVPLPANIGVRRSGSGFGTVTSTPMGINCGPVCGSSFAGGTHVTLTATPAAGSSFAGWSGDCSGAGACQLTMNAARGVTANFKPLPFVANTTSTITTTSATIATTISFARADVGKSGAVFITAWVPVKGLPVLGITTAALSQTLSVTNTRDDPKLGGKLRARQEALASVVAAVDPTAFVLVQLTASGWQVVDNGQLIPISTGVLGDSLSQNLLNNADPSKLVGAQFCVGYGASAADMITSGRIYPVASIPGSDPSVVSSGSCNVAAVPYTGLWWNPQESGWGMSITQHGSTIFAAPYTYDASGQPIWYAMPSCPIVTAGSCTGDFFQVSGGTAPDLPWNGSGKAIASAGTATLTFSDADNASFDFITLNGGLGHKSIQRQRFANGTAQLAVDYTDLWWNPDESGWGVALTQDHGTIFATWYTYDAAGRPIWYVASNCPLQSAATGNGCSGDLYQATGGSPLAANWSPSLFVTKVGSLSLAFSDVNTAVMTYTLNGVAGTRAISRQGF